MVLRLPSAASSSSKIGSETMYFSLAQLPRSCIRQRSLQNGKSLCTSESVSVLQIGHPCFISLLSVISSEARNLSFDSPRSVTDFCLGCSSNLPEHPQWRSGSNSVKFFRGEHCGRKQDARIKLLCWPRQNLRHAPNQVVCIGLRNLHLRDVPRFRHVPAGQLDVRQIELSINLRRHAFQPRFPDHGVVPGGPLDQSGKQLVLSSM